MRELQGHKDGIYALAYSSRGDLLASGGAGGDIKLWDLTEGRLLWTEPDPFFLVQCVAFSPDDQMIASGGDSDYRQGAGYLSVRSAQDGTLLFRTDIPDVSGVVFTPDGKYLISANGDRTFKVWETSNLALQHAVTAHLGPVTSVCVSADGLILATSGDYTVKLWDTKDWRVLEVLEHEIDKGTVTHATFSADGSLLAYSQGEAVIVRSVGDWQILWTFEVPWDFVLSVALSPDASFLAASFPAEDWKATLRIWRMADGELTKTLQSEYGAISDATFSRQGSLAYSDEMRLRLLDAEAFNK